MQLRSATVETNGKSQRRKLERKIKATKFQRATIQTILNNEYIRAQKQSLPYYFTNMLIWIAFWPRGVSLARAIGDAQRGARAFDHRDLGMDVDGNRAVHRKHNQSNEVRTGDRSARSHDDAATAFPTADALPEINKMSVGHDGGLRAGAQNSLKTQENIERNRRHTPFVIGAHGGLRGDGRNASLCLE